MALWGGLVDGALHCLACAWAVHDWLATEAAAHSLLLAAGDWPGLRLRLGQLAASWPGAAQTAAMAVVRRLHDAQYAALAWHAEMRRLRRYPDWRAVAASLLLSAVLLAYAALMLRLVDCLTEMRLRAAQQPPPGSTSAAPPSPRKPHDE
eukprot:EG_transcript_36912